AVIAAPGVEHPGVGRTNPGFPARQTGRRAADVALQALAIAALLALALLLRLNRIGERNIWHDEAFSVLNAAGAGPGRFLATLAIHTRRDWDAPPPRLVDVLDSVRVTENTPPLYFVLLSFWVRLFGRSELAVRSLSVLAGTLTVLLLPALTLPLV